MILVYPYRINIKTSLRLTCLKNLLKGLPLLLAISCSHQVEQNQTAEKPMAITLPIQAYSYGGRFRSGPGTNYPQAYAANYPQALIIIRDTGILQVMSGGWKIRWYEVKTDKGVAYQPADFLCLDGMTLGAIQPCATGFVQTTDKVGG